MERVSRSESAGRDDEKRVATAHMTLQISDITATNVNGKVAVTLETGSNHPTLTVYLNPMRARETAKRIEHAGDLAQLERDAQVGEERRRQS